MINVPSFSEGDPLIKDRKGLRALLVNHLPKSEDNITRNPCSLLALLKFHARTLLLVKLHAWHIMSGDIIKSQQPTRN